MTTVFLIPQKGLLVRDPVNFTPLAENGEMKPWVGREGRYWRRRVNDGTVTIKKPVAKIDKIDKRKRSN